MNRVVLIGRLTKDPELRFTPGNGTAVVRVTLAVDRRFSKAKDGKKEADFIPVVVWNNQAENLSKYTVKGNLIAVSGRIQTGSYEAKDGTRRYTTEVIAEEIQFLEWNSSNSKASNNKANNYNKSNQFNQSQQNQSNRFNDDFVDVGDDIPF